MMFKCFEILGKKTYNLQLHSLFINLPLVTNLRVSLSAPTKFNKEEARYWIPTFFVGVWLHKKPNL